MIIRCRSICRQDARENPDVLYLYSDDCDRAGDGKLAQELRGEDNAIGIRVKWNRHQHPGSFYSDKDFDVIVEQLDQDFEPVIDHVEKGGIVIVPGTPIGTAIGGLSSRAPRVYAYLQTLFEKIMK